MRPKELLFAHRYPEALEAYRTIIREHPDANYYDGLGRALLCCGQFEEAVASFRKSRELASRGLRGNLPHYTEAGTALWLLDRKEEAISEWHQGCAGILDRTIKYGDAAGGGEQGLLLWYGALACRNKVEIDYALKYLRGKLSKNAWGRPGWPAPIISMVLGDKSVADVLKIAGGSPDLTESLEQAKTGLRKRRDVCATVFYAACLERRAGGEQECARLMRLCAKLENPILQCEWYLATKEAGLTLG